MSVPNWRRNAQLFTTVSKTDTVIGIYQGVDGDGLSVVSFGSYPDDDSGLVQSIVSVRSSTRYRPAKKEPVVLTWINGRLSLTGPAHPKAADGTVVSVANPYVTVVCEGKTYTMPFDVSVAGNIKAGDPVAIDWDYR